MLPQIVKVLLDCDEDYTNEEHKRLSETIKIIVATIAGEIGVSALAAVSAGLLGGILRTPFFTIGGIVTSSAWLSKIIKGKK